MELRARRRSCFLFASFVAPVLMMLSRAVIDRDLERVQPDSAIALRQWDGAITARRAAATVSREIVATRQAGTLNQVANRLNYDMVGSRSLLYTTADRLAAGSAGTSVEDLARIDPRWGQPAIWAAMRHADGPLTRHYLLAAIDRRLNADDRIVSVPAEQAVFTNVYLRTFKISAIVALLCVALGYPVAYLLASLPERKANPLLILVLLPFWTSALVRTAAWGGAASDERRREQRAAGRRTDRCAASAHLQPARRLYRDDA